MSQQVSARVPDELNDRIEAYADENDYTKSEAVWTLLDQGLETDELRSENSRLREQLAATNRRIDETTEIVEYVREERELQRDRRDLDLQRAQAGVLTRAKWWLTGMPEPEQEFDDDRE